jgi:hypothetical protein
MGLLNIPSDPNILPNEPFYSTLDCVYCTLLPLPTILNYPLSYYTSKVLVL